MNKELIETAIDYLLDLRYEWKWKENEPAGNAEEYDELENFIALMQKELNKIS